MIKEFIKTHFRAIVTARRFLLDLIQINWIKSIYINFRFFHVSVALLFPILIYGKLKLKISKNAKVILLVPPRRGIVKIGRKYELFWFDLYGSSQIILQGDVYIKGEVWIGKGVAIYVANGAILKTGDNLTIGSLSTISCFKKITFGNYCQIGAKSSITDSNNHFFKEVSSGKVHRIEKEVNIGNYNFIGAYSIIMPGTKTPDRLTIAKGSLTNKDYTKLLSENSIIAGIPAKTIKTDIVRIFDWSKETIIRKYFSENNSEFYYDIDDSI